MYLYATNIDVQQREPKRPPDALRLRRGIRALVRRFSVSERADVACCGMTVAQAAAVEVLATEGSMRLGELGKRLGIAPSTLTRNLERLEERGLARRVPDPADARSATAELTESGREAASSLERQEAAFAATILEALPPAVRKRIADDLDALLRAVREATSSCCPGAFEHLMEEIAAPRAAGGSGR